MRLPTSLDLALCAVMALPAAAQDPVPLYPDNYRVLSENERVRVVDFSLKRGATEAHKKTPHLRASFEKRQREGWTTEIMVFKKVPE